MKRRDLIIGPLVSLVSTASFAQKVGKIRRIAIAHASSPIADIRIDGDNPLVNVFFEELLKLGYVEGRNLEIVRFSANGHTDHFREIARERDHLDCRFLRERGIIGDPTVVDLNGAALRPTQCSKGLLERRAARNCFDVIRGERAHYGDAAHRAGSLRPRREWPRCRRSAEKPDELAALRRGTFSHSLGQKRS